MNNSLLVLGATGFVGRATVQEALRAGWHVKALVRSPDNEHQVRRWGAQAVAGLATEPSGWADDLRGCAVVVDLIQPRLPARIRQKDIQRVAGERMVITERLLATLGALPASERPMFFSVSGLDDLEPDAQGRVLAESPLRARPVGFAHIGVPIRRRIEASSLASCFVYLGTVYGPGKAFAASVFPQLAEGKFRIAGAGDNRMPLIHVDDAARAIVHLAGLPRAVIEKRSFILTDGSLATLSEFMNHAADLMGAKRPRSVPRWLASLVAGRILVEVMSRDVPAEPDALLRTGFQFRYRSFREGLPPTLAQLGYPHDRSKVCGQLVPS